MRLKAFLLIAFAFYIGQTSAQKVEFPHQRVILKYSLSSLFPTPISTQVLALEYQATTTMNLEHEIGFAPESIGWSIGNGQLDNKYGYYGRTQFKFYSPSPYNEVSRADRYLAIDVFFKRNHFVESDWVWRNDFSYREYVEAERIKTVYGFHFVYGFLTAPVGFPGMYLDVSAGFGLRLIRNNYDPNPVFATNGFRQNLSIPSLLFNFKFGWGRPMRNKNSE